MKNTKTKVLSISLVFILAAGLAISSAYAIERPERAFDNDGFDRALNEEIAKIADPEVKKAVVERIIQDRPELGQAIRREDDFKAPGKEPITKAAPSLEDKIFKDREMEKPTSKAEIETPKVEIEKPKPEIKPDPPKADPPPPPPKKSCGC